MFSKSWFDGLDSQLRTLGLDSDDKSFDEILRNLKSPKRLSPDEFASTVAYVILASGFRQTTAKKIHRTLMAQLPLNPAKDDLLRIFNNPNKINAILVVWNNRTKFCAKYYECKTLQDKLNYLRTLPHIGNITAGHLARNLGEDMVKYDIWIQRLGAVYGGTAGLVEKVNNANLNPEIKRACDDMFDQLVRETGLPRGYIDVVLFRACQNHMIDAVCK